MTICEIGPGLGDLTRKRLECSSKVAAFEIDTDLYAILQKKFHQEIEEERLLLSLGDVTEIWGEKLLETPYRLVANLPYYVATKIILKALQDSNCKELTVMVQKEVAQKFCAKNGESDFGAISVLAESIGERELLFDVPPTSFDPEPKVMSSVMRITKHKEIAFEDFSDFLRVAFLAPRKKLSKSLAQKYSKESIVDAFLTLNIDDNRRAHEIPTLLYHQIFKILEY